MKSKIQSIQEANGGGYLAELGIFVLIAVLAVLFFTPKEETALKESRPAALEEAGFKGSQSEKTFPGVTLIPQAGTAEVLLINMAGDTVHKWSVDAQRARLLPNCNLLVLHGTKWGLQHPHWEQLQNKVREYDWEGNVVWEYTTTNNAHHDIHQLSNNNLIFLHRTTIPKEYKETIIDPVRKRMRIRSDEILEVSRQGKIVWQWNYLDHFNPNMCGFKKCKPARQQVLKNKKSLDWTHTNTVTVIPENDLYDTGDKRFKPGNLIILPRNWSTVLILDKESGKVVWNYTGDYKGGLSGGHEAHMIKRGFPGAGNILIFDNGRLNLPHPGSSFIIEINPSTKEIVWVYDVDTEFFSHAAGSMQRLPNGNTLISEDIPGKIFEVTPAKQTVWEYQSSVRTCRAHRYPYTYCAQLLVTNPRGVSS